LRGVSSARAIAGKAVAAAAKSVIRNASRREIVICIMISFD
jgi:hypothetical protein